MDIMVVKNSSGVVAILAFFMSLALFFCPNTLKKLSDYLNKWISLRKTLRPLEIVRNADEQVYKMHKIMALLSLVFAIICSYWYITL